MECNENALKSYHHHNYIRQTSNPIPTTPSGTGISTTTTTTTTTNNNNKDGGMYTSNNNQNHQNHNSHHFSSTEPVFSSPHSHSLPTHRSNLPPPPETVKRKRGRPRKYGTLPEGLPRSVKHISSPPRKKEPSPSSAPFSKKPQFGSTGQSFTPHVITVAAGEDAAQKILSFTQQTKCAVCILSASGSVFNASLRQSALSGTNVMYEGPFEILSLSGSFLYSEIGGSSSRTGRLSVCLSGADGHIIGGVVAGPLRAAGPVQVITGTFLYDATKDMIFDKMLEASLEKPPSQVPEATITSVSFHMAPDSFGRFPFRENEHENIGGNFMSQPTSPGFNYWRSSLDARGDVEFSGRIDHVDSQFLDEDGDDE